MASSQVRCCVTHLWSCLYPHTLSYSLELALVCLYSSSQEASEGRDMDAPALSTPEKSSVDPGEGLGAKGEL